MKRALRLPHARTEDLVIRELDDETLIYDIERDTALCLNQTAALVWQQCDGTTTATEAARALQAKLNRPIDADMVWLAVNDLSRFHLVGSVDKPVRVSRRALVLKYAPALALLPVIASIAAPPAAQAASCSGSCGYFAGCPVNCSCVGGVCVPA